MNFVQQFFDALELRRRHRRMGYRGYRSTNALYGKPFSTRGLLLAITLTGSTILLATWWLAAAKG